MQSCRVFCDFVHLEGVLRPQPLRGRAWSPIFSFSCHCSDSNNRQLQQPELHAELAPSSSMKLELLQAAGVAFEVPGTPESLIEDPFSSEFSPTQPPSSRPCLQPPARSQGADTIAPLDDPFLLDFSPMQHPSKPHSSPAPTPSNPLLQPLAQPPPTDTNGPFDDPFASDFSRSNPEQLHPTNTGAGAPAAPFEWRPSNFSASMPNSNTPDSSPALCTSSLAENRAYNPPAPHHRSEAVSQANEGRPQAVNISTAGHHGSAMHDEHDSSPQTSPVGTEASELEALGISPELWGGGGGQQSRSKSAKQRKHQHERKQRQGKRARSQSPTPRTTHTDAQTAKLSPGAGVFDRDYISDTASEEASQTVGAPRGTRKGVIYWIRQDLRLHDNRALCQAAELAQKHGGRVYCVYIHSPGALDQRSTDSKGGYL